MQPRSKTGSEDALKETGAKRDNQIHNQELAKPRTVPPGLTLGQTCLQGTLDDTKSGGGQITTV